MRMVLIALLIIFLSSTAHATDWVNESSCVGAWLYDTTDSPTLDSCGSATGTITGATHATADPAATYSSGYYTYDGSNDNINYGDIPGIDDATTLTIVSWVYQDNLTQDHWIFGQSDSATTRGIFFQVDDVSSQTSRTDVYRFFIFENGGASRNLETPSSGASSGVWEHVAVTFSPDSGSGLRMYVDGVQISGSPASSVGVDNAGEISTDFCSGERCSTGAHDRDGRQDETAAFNVVLSITDINDIFDNGLSQDGVTAPQGINLFGNVSIY